MFKKIDNDMNKLKLSTLIIICLLFIGTVGIYDLMSYIVRIYRLLLKG